MIYGSRTHIMMRQADFFVDPIKYYGLTKQDLKDYGDISKENLK